MRHTLIVSIAALVSSSACFGGFTDVGKAPAQEQSQEKILETLYGGDFVRTDNNFSNGSILVLRVDDFGAVTDDQITGVKFAARPVAKFSGNSQSLSLVKGGSSSTLFDVAGYGYDVSGVSGKGASFSELASFSRSGNSGTHSSIPDENPDDRDHLISYDVQGVGVGNEKVWLMFWEDMNVNPATPKKRSGSDFNDLVVEVRATAVPLPAAAWVGGALIGTVGIMRKRLGTLAGL